MVKKHINHHHLFPIFGPTIALWLSPRAAVALACEGCKCSFTCEAIPKGPIGNLRFFGEEWLGESPEKLIYRILMSFDICHHLI